MSNTDRQLAEKDMIIANKDALIVLLRTEVTMLKEHVKELERRLNLNSSNSSKPPSSDGLKKRPPTSLRLKGQNPSGGQIGHKGHTRAQQLEPTRIIQHPVHECEACKKSLTDQAPSTQIKRQVFEIPVPTIEVIEHQADVKTCSCGHTTTANFPTNVTAPVQYGPRIKSLAVYLSNQQLIPEDRLKQLFSDVFELDISTGTLASINQKFSALIKTQQDDVLNLLKNAPVKNLDETGFRIGAKTQWLHVISNDKMTHYRVSPKRKDLLNDVTGVVVHDHWKPYFQMTNVQHALCNAHILREWKALQEIEKEPWAMRMLKLLRVTARFKKPPIGRIGACYDAIVNQGLAFHTSQSTFGKRKKRIGHNLLVRLRDFKNAVLRFAIDPLVPFTNNQAEQDIRMMKVKQKISGGFRTTNGADIFCTIRGFISTQRKQDKKIFREIVMAFD